jgi:hypothetical protein
MPPDLPASRHVVVDVAYLTQLVDPNRPPSDDGLDAAAWGEALKYAGVLPLLRELGPGGGVEGDLRGVSTALGRLQEAEARGTSLRAWIPQRPSLPQWLLLAVALGGLGLFLAGQPLTGVFVLAAVAVLAVVGRTVLSAPMGPIASEQVARRAVARSVRSLLAHSRVEAVGPSRLVVEVAPHAALLRQRVQQLDAVLERARARASELAALAGRIRLANENLGRPQDDAETERLAIQQHRVEGEMARVRDLRGRFGEALSSVEDHLERLRLVAVRGALSRRVDEVAEAHEASGQEAAAAEVDALGLERMADGLAREVADATLALAATLEMAAMAEWSGPK